MTTPLTTPLTAPLTARLAAIPAIADPYEHAPYDSGLYVVTDDEIIIVDTVAHLASEQVVPVEICHSLRILIAGTGWLPAYGNPAMYRIRALACYTLVRGTRRIVAVTPDRVATAVQRFADDPVVEDPGIDTAPALSAALGDLAAAWHQTADRYAPIRPRTPYDVPEIANLAAMIAHGAPGDLPADVWIRCGLHAVRLHAAQISAPLGGNRLIRRGIQVRATIRDDVESGELDHAYANRLLTRIGLPELARMYQVAVDVSVQIEVAATDPDAAEQKALDLLEGITGNGDADWDWANHEIRRVVPGRLSFDDTDLEVTW